VTSDGAPRPRREEVDIEERGGVGEALLGLAQAGVGGAAGAWVGSKLSSQGAEQPPPKPPEPKIELPPGVEVSDNH
jgi:hypothetical protein